MLPDLGANVNPEIAGCFDQVNGDGTSFVHAYMAVFAGTSAQSALRLSFRRTCLSCKHTARRVDNFGLLHSQLETGFGSRCTEQEHVDHAVGSAVMRQESGGDGQPAAVVGVLCKHEVSDGAETRPCNQKSVIGHGYLESAPQLLFLVAAAGEDEHLVKFPGQVTAKGLAVETLAGIAVYRVLAFVYNPIGHFTCDVHAGGQYWHVDPIHSDFCAPRGCVAEGDHLFRKRCTASMKHDHFDVRDMSTYSRVASRSLRVCVCVCVCVCGACVTLHLSSLALALSFSRSLLSLSLSVCVCARACVCACVVGAVR